MAHISGPTLDALAQDKTITAQLYGDHVCYQGELIGLASKLTKLAKGIRFQTTDFTGRKWQGKAPALSGPATLSRRRTV